MSSKEEQRSATGKITKRECAMAAGVALAAVGAAQCHFSGVDSGRSTLQTRIVCGQPANATFGQAQTS
jgi:hypothetical protein